MKAENEEFSVYPAKIKVVGIGGGGCNAVERMYEEGIEGVEFIAANSDVQHLAGLKVPSKIQLGKKLTRGLGVGGDPKLGEKAAEESREVLAEAIKGSDLVFLTAGMGGGTGTGGIPILAEICKEAKALTVAVVTLPFSFEGTHRAKVAEEGLIKLQDKVDTLIVIPNDRLLEFADQRLLFREAFRMADNALYAGVKGISELVTVQGVINLDLADLRAVLSNAGPAWMAIGRGTGHNRAVEAAKNALSSSLLGTPVRDAKRILYSIMGGPDLTLHEVKEVGDFIRSAADPDAMIIFGVVQNEDISDEIRIILVATGFPAPSPKKEERKPSLAEEKEELASLKEGEKLDIPTFLRRAALR